MKTCLIIQPGAFGDIFICAPIAKWYHKKGYEIFWPVARRFISTISYFDYVNPIQLNEDVLDQDWLKSDVLKILPMRSNYFVNINMADRGPHPTFQGPHEKFDVAKYRMAVVPIEEKRNLVWTRNKEKEDALYNLINPKKPYTIASLVSSHKDKATIPADFSSSNLVEIREVEGYNIQDWYRLIEESSTIFSVESAVQCFIEGCGDRLRQKKYLLKRSSISDGNTYTYSPSWDTKYFT